MTTRAIDLSDWHVYLNKVSADLSNRRAEVRIVSPRLGNQVEAAGVRLIGITYDPKNQVLEVALEGLGHLIQKPVELYVQDGPSGVESFSILDAKGNRHIVSDAAAGYALMGSVAAKRAGHSAPAEERCIRTRWAGWIRFTAGRPTAYQPRWGSTFSDCEMLPPAQSRLLRQPSLPPLSFASKRFHHQSRGATALARSPAWCRTVVPECRGIGRHGCAVPTTPHPRSCARARRSPLRDGHKPCRLRCSQWTHHDCR